MSQPLSASHCLVYLRIPQLNLTSGFGSISRFSTPLCYVFTCINCYFLCVKLCAYLQGVGSANTASLYIIVCATWQGNTMEQIQHLYGGQDNQSVASSSRIPADYGDLEDQLCAALDRI